MITANQFIFMTKSKKSGQLIHQKCIYMTTHSPGFVDTSIKS